MIFGLLILAIAVVAQLPAPHNFILGGALIFAIPSILRWGRGR